jgi:hypothetical protein
MEDKDKAHMIECKEIMNDSANYILTPFLVLDLKNVNVSHLFAQHTNSGIFCSVLSSQKKYL